MRDAVARTLGAAGDRAASAAVVCAAALTLAAGAAVGAVALGVALAGLPGHPVALLVAVATVVATARGVPLLALLAARVTARAVDRSG